MESNFGDIETWTIWGNCVYNQNLVMSKNLKDNQNLLKIMMLLLKDLMSMEIKDSMQ